MLRLAGWIFTIVCLTAAAFASPPPDRVWREGELTSRKTLTVRHKGAHSQYFYRLRAGGVRYLVRSDEPLNLSLYTPLQFSIARSHILIRDGNGTERKVAILQKAKPSFRR